jgi:microcystin-dependent protein
MSEPFLGQIMLVPYNFAPRGWAFCSGQILSIAQNTALFSLLGTTYGGNGQTTFALPDLRGRVPVSSGQGPGLSNYSLGQVSGTETTTLLITQMPQHTHGVGPLTINAKSGPGNTRSPELALPAMEASGVTATYSNDGAPPNITLSPLAISAPPGTIQPTGGNQPFSIVQPYLTLNYCIALEGIFPSRN